MWWWCVYVACRRTKTMTGVFARPASTCSSSSMNELEICCGLTSTASVTPRFDSSTLCSDVSPSTWRCLAVWRVKSCHFGGTKSVKTARWRSLRSVVRRVPTLSRISYELFTKCVLTHSVCTERYRRHKSWHFGNKFLNISKSSPRHGTHYFTRPASPRTLSRVLPSSARQIACHGVNSLSCMPVWRLSYCLLVYGKAVAATSRWRRHWGHVCTVSANRSASLGQNCYNKSITPMGRHDKPCRHQWGTARGLL